MQINELIYHLARQVESKRASSFYLNGAPGSGKSVLLQQLAKELPTAIPRLQVFGPYHVETFESLNESLLRDCLDSAYISEYPQQDIFLDLISTWYWLKQNLKAASRQTLVVLIDLNYKRIDDFEVLRSWFSSIHKNSSYFSKFSRIITIC